LLDIRCDQQLVHHRNDCKGLTTHLLDGTRLIQSMPHHITSRVLTEAYEP